MPLVSKEVCQGLEEKNDKYRLQELVEKVNGQIFFPCLGNIPGYGLCASVLPYAQLPSFGT